MNKLHREKTILSLSLKVRKTELLLRNCFRKKQCFLFNWLFTQTNYKNKITVRITVGILELPLKTENDMKNMKYLIS